MSKYNQGYNAVHVRRSDHVSRDRKSAEQYYKFHDLASFNKTFPLYVATDERKLKWFNYFKRFPKKRFRSLIFWKDLDKEILHTVLPAYPESMHSDVLGFVEQLICGNAIQWEGSYKSTFSAAIATIRTVPALRLLNYSFPPRPSQRKAGEATAVGGAATEMEEDF